MSYHTPTITPKSNYTKRAAKEKAACVILCRARTSPEMLSALKEIFVINTPLDAFRASRVIYDATPVSRVCNRDNLVSFHLDDYIDTVRELTEYLLEALNEIPSVNIMGAFDTDKTLGIVSFVVEGYESSEVGTILDDEYDIAVRTGYHCAPYIHDYLGDKPYHGTIRVGLGQFNTKEDIDALVNAIVSL